MPGELALSMRGIVKRFGALTANDHIDLDVNRGEVHALLGENGAGKTTLMNVLFGLYHADSGQMWVSGQPYAPKGPSDAIAAGIGMVHQHFMLVPTFSVMENIILGQEPTLGVWLDRHAAKTKVTEISAHYGLSIEPDALVQDISVGMQQRVEIIKVLYRGADILIFDEPTAVLTPQEVDEFMEITRNLVRQGKTVIIISHKLAEIKRCADRCTVIRRGRHVSTVHAADTSEKALAELMIGQALTTAASREANPPGEPALALQSLCVIDKRGLPAVTDFSLTIQKGEIVGLAGVDGNGQAELVEALMGLLPVQSGQICLLGADITHAAVRTRLRKGLGAIPADRHRHGLVLPFTMAENMILERRYDPAFCRLGFMRHAAMTAYAGEQMEAFDVRPRSPEQPAATFSGGNQQKAIIARVIRNNPSVLIAVQPTRGLDIGAMAFVHAALIAQRNAGRAILLVSLDLEEIMSLSDRIAVIYEGRLTGLCEGGQADDHTLGLWMTGGAAHGHTGAV